MRSDFRKVFLTGVVLFFGLMLWSKNALAGTTCSGIYLTSCESSPAAVEAYVQCPPNYAMKEGGAAEGSNHYNRMSIGCVDPSTGDFSWGDTPCYTQGGNCTWDNQANNLEAHGYCPTGWYARGIGFSVGGGDVHTIAMQCWNPDTNVTSWSNWTMEMGANKAANNTAVEGFVSCDAGNREALRAFGFRATDGHTSAAWGDCIRIDPIVAPSPGQVRGIVINDSGTIMTSKPIKVNGTTYNTNGSGIYTSGSLTANTPYLVEANNPMPSGYVWAASCVNGSEPYNSTSLNCNGVAASAGGWNSGGTTIVSVPSGGFTNVRWMYFASPPPPAQSSIFGQVFDIDDNSYAVGSTVNGPGAARTTVTGIQAFYTFGFALQPAPPHANYDIWLTNIASRYGNPRTSTCFSDTAATSCTSLSWSAIIGAVPPRVTVRAPSDGFTEVLWGLEYMCLDKSTASGLSKRTYACDFLGTEAWNSLRWNALPGPIGTTTYYTLRYCQGSGCTVTAASATLTPANYTGTTFEHHFLVDTETYKYKLWAYNSASGCGGVYSNPSPQVTVVASNPPDCTCELLGADGPCSTLGELRCGAVQPKRDSCVTRIGPGGSLLCWYKTTDCNATCELCSGAGICGPKPCSDFPGYLDSFNGIACDSTRNTDHECGGDTCNQSQIRYTCDQNGTKCPWCWEPDNCTGNYWCNQKPSTGHVCTLGTSLDDAADCGDGQCFGSEKTRSPICADCTSCITDCASAGLNPCNSGDPAICLNDTTPALCQQMKPGLFCYVAQAACGDPICEVCSGGACRTRECNEYAPSYGFSGWGCNYPDDTFGVDAGTYADCDPADPGLKRNNGCGSGDERCAYPDFMKCPPTGLRETCKRARGVVACRYCWAATTSCNTATSFCVIADGTCDTATTGSTTGGCGNSTFATAYTAAAPSCNAEAHVAGTAFPPPVGDPTSRCRGIEDATNCPCDCDTTNANCYSAVPCGNGTIDPGETCNNCPADVGACPLATCTINWYCDPLNPALPCTTWTDRLNADIELRADIQNSGSSTLTCATDIDGTMPAFPKSILPPTPDPNPYSEKPFDFNIPPVRFSPNYYACSLDVINADNITTTCSTPPFYLVHCGDGICQGGAGETITTCPDDCGCKGPFPVTWTDDPTVTADTTIVKAAHFREIKANIDILRADAGLPPFIPGGTYGANPHETISYRFIRDARFAIEEVYNACNIIEATKATPRPPINLTDASVLGPGSWEDPTVSLFTTTPVRAVHINQLRKAIEMAY